MVYFFHELTIQMGEGTIKEVIKCYFQSCLDEQAAEVLGALPQESTLDSDSIPMTPCT